MIDFSKPIEIVDGGEAKRLLMDETRLKDNVRHVIAYRQSSSDSWQLVWVDDAGCIAHQDKPFVRNIPQRLTVEVCRVVETIAPHTEHAAIRFSADGCISVHGYYHTPDYFARHFTIVGTGWQTVEID